MTIEELAEKVAKLEAELKELKEALNWNEGNEGNKCITINCGNADS